MDKIKTVICLAGQEFRIKVGDDEAYVQQLADFVNGKIDSVQSVYPQLSSNQSALYALLELADEYQKLKKNYEELEGRISQLRDIPRTSPSVMPVKRPFESVKKPVMTES